MKEPTYESELRDALWYTMVHGKIDKQQDKFNSIVKMGDRIRANTSALASVNLPDIGDCICYGFHKEEFLQLRVESIVHPGMHTMHVDYFLFCVGGQWLTFDEMMQCTS